LHSNNCTCINACRVIAERAATFVKQSRNFVHIRWSTKWYEYFNQRHRDTPRVLRHYSTQNLEIILSGETTIEAYRLLIIIAKDTRVTTRERIVQSRRRTFVIVESLVAVRGNAGGGKIIQSNFFRHGWTLQRLLLLGW